jgi:hypothetical protein
MSLGGPVDLVDAPGSHSDDTTSRRVPGEDRWVSRRVDPVSRPSAAGDRCLVSGRTTTTPCTASASTFGVPGRAVSREGLQRVVAVGDPDHPSVRGRRESRRGGCGDRGLRRKGLVLREGRR